MGAGVRGFGPSLRRIEVVSVKGLGSGREVPVGHIGSSAAEGVEHEEGPSRGCSGLAADASRCRVSRGPPMFTGRGPVRAGRGAWVTLPRLAPAGFGGRGGSRPVSPPGRWAGAPGATARPALRPTPPPPRSADPLPAPVPPGSAGPGVARRVPSPRGRSRLPSAARRPGRGGAGRRGAGAASLPGSAREGGARRLERD